MHSNKNKVLKIIAYLLLFILTFGTVIYGIANEKTFDVVYKGSVYKEVDYQSYVNSENHHIYIEKKSNEEIFWIDITIEGDDVILSWTDDFFKYKIKKDSNILEGGFEELKTIENHQYQDYIDLLNSYRTHEITMDEFPGILIFTFFAIPPFIFGLILITSMFKKRLKSPSIIHYIIWSLLMILFLAHVVLLMFIVKVNIS